MTKMFEEGGA